MIRRIYVMPVNPRTSANTVSEFVRALNDADLHIPGMRDSFAAVEASSNTVVWEMVFQDEETYTGPYMVHPYHIATLDNYLLADSPERITHNIGATRYRMPPSVLRLQEGVRRIILLQVPEGASTAAIEGLVAKDDLMAASTWAADDLAWRSSKGLNWTHVWEQTFTDGSALDQYLKTPEGVASSTRDGLRYIGANVSSLRVLSYPFVLKSMTPSPAAPTGQSPVLYSMTIRTALEDFGAFIDILETDYDPSLARVGGTLIHRWRTLDGAYSDPEVQSLWRLDSLTTFKDFRSATVAGADESWNRFVTYGMPLVRSGARRFYRGT